MNDNEIIELLFDRTEAALTEIERQYSRLYKKTIRSILENEDDVKECANDVLLAVWKSIPPNRPISLSAYICSIAKRIGIDRLRYNTRKKRSAEYTITMSELDDCLPQNAGDREEDGRELHDVLSDFVRELEPKAQILFIRRYIYFETMASLAARFDMSENHIAVILYRTRKKLKKRLEKEGLYL